MDDNLNLTVAVTTNNPAERKAATRLFGKAGQRPSSTPDPTDRCSGETFSQPNRVPSPLSSGGHSKLEKTTLLTRRLVNLTELFLCCPRFIGNIGK